MFAYDELFTTLSLLPTPPAGFYNPVNKYNRSSFSICMHSAKPSVIYLCLIRLALFNDTDVR